MLAPADSTLHLRTRPPSLRVDRLIERSELMTALVDALQHQRLVLICAPAGFGKTTSLASALLRLPEDVASAWFAADADDDLCRLAAGIVVALEALDLPWRRSPQALISDLAAGPEHWDAFALALGAALRDSGRRRGVLVVDDLHRIDDPQLPAFLDLLLARLPEHWNLTLASRVEPTLALGRLAIQGEVAEFSQELLRFGPAEVERLLNTRGIGTEDAHQLHALTLGWPAALGLWLHRCKAEGSERVPHFDPTARRRLFDYLAQEVLDTQPAPLQNLLMRCSVLPHLQAARCAAVAEEPQAAHWLQVIESRGLFVRRLADAEPSWVLDDLFRDFLDEQLRQRLPDELPTLLQRAADTEPDAVHRVGLLLRAQSFERAAQALMDNATGLLAAGETAQIRRLLERFPAAQRSQLPAWHFVQGRLALTRWDWPALQNAMRSALDGFNDQGWTDMAHGAAVLHALSQAGRGRLEAAGEELRRLRAQSLPAADRAVLEHVQSWVSAGLGPAQDAGAAIERMLAALEDGASAWVWFLCLPNFRFTTMAALGPPIDRLAERALQVADDEGGLPLRIGALLLQGWRRLWQDDLAGARQLLAAADEEARWGGLPHSLQWSRLAAQAFIDGLSQDAAGLRSTMERLAANFPVGSPWRRVALTLWLRMAWLAGDRETWTQLQPLVASAAAAGEWPFARWGAELAEAHRRLELDADPAGAQLLLQPALEGLAGVDVFGLGTYGRGLLALAQLRSGRADAAWQVFSPALQGPTLPLRLLGPAILGELATICPPGADLARLRGLTQACGAESLQAPAPAALSRAAVELSQREVEVLARLAAGESNKLIARALGLSPFTVKRHVSNIFDKLAVTTRAQAAVRFQTLSKGEPGTGTRRQAS